MSIASSSNLRTKAAYDFAEAHDLDVVLPESDELQIDIDTAEQRKTLDRLIDVANANGYGVTIKKETVSRSGNTHVYLKWERGGLSPVDRILLQACFGSDPVREFLSYRRLAEGESAPTLFYETKNRLEIKVEKVACNCDDIVF